MKGLAFYYLGKECQSRSAYGEELGYYTAAMKHVKNAAQHKSAFPELDAWFNDYYAVSIPTQRYLTFPKRVANSFKQAEKDNNLIYHERVIPEHKLPPLEKKSMSTPLDLPDEKFSFSGILR